MNNFKNMIFVGLRTFFLRALLSATFFMSISSSASVDCVDANIISAKLITDVCWECIFPLRVAGVTLAGNDKNRPGEAVKMPLCACNDDLGVPRPGLVTSYWEPARLIEFQRTPGCSSVLGGMKFPIDQLNHGHDHEKETQDESSRFRHYHYYAFPLLAMLDMFTNISCGQDGYVDLDLMYISELDPTWNDDSISFFTTPEAAIAANPLMIASCSLDAAAVTVTGQPISQMWWCAGTWGSMYPFSGNVFGTRSLMKDTSLYTAKVLGALHRRGITQRTMGEDAMCKSKIEPTLPKKQYKISLIYPIPETRNNHWIGQSVFEWGLARTIPATGENPVSIIWRWNDCCMIKGN